MSAEDTRKRSAATNSPSEPMHEARQLVTLSEADKLALADLFEARIRKLASDGAFVRPIWREGYDNLSAHTIDGLSLWVGRKVIMVIIAAVFTATLTWAVIFKGGK